MAIDNSIVSGKAINCVTASGKYATNGVNLAKIGGSSLLSLDIRFA